MTGNVATLVVHRPDRPYMDRLRRYQIWLDGEWVGAVARGGTERFEIAAPGRHRVRAAIDWSGSPDLEFAAGVGEEVHVEVVPRGNAFTAILHIWDSTSYLVLERSEHREPV